MTIIQRWKFTLLLVALLILMVVYPLIEGDGAFYSLLYDVLLILVFLASILFVYQRGVSRLVALLLGTPAIVGTVTQAFFPLLSPLPRSVLFQLCPAAFLIGTVVTVLHRIFTEGRFSIDGINGALSGYLLLGLAFGHLYCFTEVVRPDSFHLAEHLGRLPAGEERRHVLFTYFSLVTLTTLGYGDITPWSRPARSLAWFEAVLGQFYVAVIIADLIALRVSAMIEKQPRIGGL
jgi:hypothetical protein